MFLELVTMEEELRRHSSILSVFESGYDDESDREEASEICEDSSSGGIVFEDDRNDCMIINTKVKMACLIVALTVLLFQNILETKGLII